MVRVAVIGAGPSGTAALRAFQSAIAKQADIGNDLEIVCFEKQADIGGLVSSPHLVAHLYVPRGINALKR